MKLAGIVAAVALGALVPVHAGNLRWASQGEISTLDPHSANENFNNGQASQVYEPLAERGSNYAEIVPALAVAWENVAPNTWIVKLRQDVAFHDGTPFTADDVVFSYNRARVANSTFKLYSSQAGIPRRVDNYTVEFTTDGPSPLFHENLANIFIMSKAWAEKHGATKPQDFRAKEDSFSARNAMGTGPYKLVSHETGVRTRYTKNPAWWGLREPGRWTGNVETVEYRPITNSATRMAALRSGELDVVLDPPVQEIDQLRRDQTLKVWEGREARVIFIAFDHARDELLTSDVGGRNPFRDRRVRQALYQAIDIETIRKQVMRGLSEPTAILMPDPKGGGVPPAMDKRLPYDPRAAKQLLSDAGYPNGFRFTLNCPNDRYINDERICVAVAAMWARIGVNVRVETLPRTQYFPYLARLEANAFLYGWGGGSSEGIDILKPVLHTRTTTGAGDNNFGRLSHARLDELIMTIDKEMDTAKRHAMVTEAMKVIQEEVLEIPLHRQVTPWVSKVNISVVHRPNNILQPRWVSMK